jgi:ribosomal protein S18 acetylase RimI-like enzyme
MNEKSLRIIQVRKAAKKYKQALVELVNVYLSGKMGENRQLDGKAQKRLVFQLFRHPGALVFFAETGKKPVGLAVCFTVFSTFSAKKIINIHDLIVLPECRGRGIAGRLLDAVEDKARELDCCKLTLEVRVDNKKGMRLYKKHGFSGGEHPMFFWGKALRR